MNRHRDSAQFLAAAIAVVSVLVGSLGCSAAAHPAASAAQAPDRPSNPTSATSPEALPAPELAGRADADGAQSAGSDSGCPAGKQRDGAGCCWPNQTWSEKDNACQGSPACPDRFLASGGSCTPLAEEVTRLATRCGAAAIGELNQATGEMPATPAECVRLGGLLPAATAELESACEGGHKAACEMLGTALLGHKTAVLSIELHSRPCARGKEDCYGHSRRIAQSPFAAPKTDELRAQSFLAKACDAGQTGACIELGIALFQTDRIGAAERLRRACLGNSPAACAEAVYLVRATSRVEDPELHAHATTVLSGHCEKGNPLACNNLGFMVERSMVADREPLEAASFYRKACELGEAIGCANLMFFAENHRAQVRRLSFGGASDALASACASRPGEQLLCFAEALALRRGFGVKAQYGKATKLLKSLCKAGSEDACAVR